MTLNVMLTLLFLCASLLANTIFVFKFLWTSRSRARSYAANAATLAFTLMFIFLLTELSFYTFSTGSDGFNFTLSSQRWYEKHWFPINSRGYRDKEHSIGPEQGVKTIFVIGDSFVAGSGIEDANDRFSNILGSELGKEWRIFNIAKPGWNTMDELSALKAEPSRPDIIVLSHYINDIEDAARLEGLKRPALKEPPPPILEAPLRHSHLLNYAYWKLYRFRNMKEVEKTFGDYLEKCYMDNNVWRIHTNLLLEFRDYAAEEHARLIVVVFPDIIDPNWGKRFTDKVYGFLLDSGIEAINLADVLSGRDPAKLIANRYDSHPNESVHKEVADLLFEKISAGSSAPGVSE